MGYKPAAKFYDLEFEDFPGLEVKMRSASLGEIKHAYSLNINMQEKDPDKQMEAFKFFESKLVSWNLEHPEVEGGGNCPQCGLTEDQAMLPVVECMLCLELSMLLKMLMGWINTMATVAGPKGMNSLPGGNNIPEEATRLLEQMQSPGTLPTPNLS